MKHDMYIGIFSLTYIRVAITAHSHKATNTRQAYECNSADRQTYRQAVLHNKTDTSKLLKLQVNSDYAFFLLVDG